LYGSNEGRCRAGRLYSVTDNSLRKGLALKGARDRAAGRRFELVKVQVVRSETKMGVEQAD